MSKLAQKSAKAFIESKNKMSQSKRERSQQRQAKAAAFSKQNASVNLSRTFEDAGDEDSMIVKKKSNERILDELDDSDDDVFAKKPKPRSRRNKRKI